MKKKFKNIDKVKISNSKIVEPGQVSKSKSIFLFIKKSILLILILFLVIVSINLKGLFDSSDVNYHSKRAWNEFYTFTKLNEIDILLVGNSHLYTGINPQSLSTSLGINSFMLSAPGTNLADVYFSLKEALVKCKPKVVVLETYSIGDFNPYQLEGSALSDQIKSFVSRKNLYLKIVSTPFLFAPSNYLYAWSSLLRNHSFIFSDLKQIQLNSKKRDVSVPALGEDFKLGKFIRFVNGINQETLDKYDQFGAPVQGSDYKYSNYAKIYLEKIKKLTEDNNIQLVFLTLPMYHRHVENYSAWRNKLNEIIQEENFPWLDLQERYYNYGFDENSFENTYEGNQHMTYSGSITASYALAKFIRDDLKLSLPNRFSEENWLNLFYGKDSYFENCDFLDSKGIGKSFGKNIVYNGLPIKEIISYKKLKSNVLLLKLDNKVFGSEFLRNKKIVITVRASVNNLIELYNVELFKDVAWNPLDHHIYFHFSPDLEVIEVLNVFLAG